MPAEDASEDAPGTIMEVGSLRRIAIESDECMREVVKEVSLMETTQMMLDEDVETRRLCLQLGSISLERAYDLSKPIIVELFSPPRLTDYAAHHHLGAGLALDLRTVDETGKQWDFCLTEMREKARSLLDVVQPDLLLGCPPCSQFSPLQRLNRARGSQVGREQQYLEAVQHLEFCCGEYMRQMERGKYFVHEHPRQAESWNLHCIQDMSSLPNVLRVDGDMCAQGMEIEDADGGGQGAEADARYLTNAPEIARELEKRCTNEPDSLRVWRQTTMHPKRGLLPCKGGPRGRPDCEKDDGGSH